ncbi:nudix hydrolase 6-like protein [Artemisia annua]|uniref:Nudix hydrolase 6-like protein n=1 Tax=Artemisia annua TaxID=35608 RepID=A0A2U1PUR8_ARTAN|nr:nudix hydrolase 6-like protein [Artemisia annua]
MERSAKVPENELVRVDMLNASYDGYHGVIVNLKEDMDENVFTALLQASISQWRQQGKKGVWLKLSIELVNLVKPAVKLLAVQEKYGAFKGTGVWKLPTGTVEEGEDISVAAMREVKEEAGIDTEFLEVLAFRQCHKSFYSKSDLMFVCMLKPKSFIIQKQDSEIEAAQWMPVEDYANQLFMKEHKSFNYIAKICLAKKDNKYDGFSALPIATATSDNKSYIYSKY